jgi:hypothetical protein
LKTTYEEKSIKAKELKEFFKRNKQFLIANKLGENTYKDSNILTNMTSILITLMELEENYMECAINSMDSVMDNLAEKSPEFYRMAELGIAINRDIEKENIRVMKRKKYGLKDGVDEDNNKARDFKRKILLTKQEQYLIPDDE